MRTRCTSMPTVRLSVCVPSVHLVVCLFVGRPGGPSVRLSSVPGVCQAYLCVDSGVQYEDQVYVYAVRPSVCLCAVRPPVVLPVRRTCVLTAGCSMRTRCTSMPSVRPSVCLCAVRPPVVLPVWRTCVLTAGCSMRTRCTSMPSSVRLSVCVPSVRLSSYLSGVPVC